MYNNTQNNKLYIYANKHIIYKLNLYNNLLLLSYNFKNLGFDGFFKLIHYYLHDDMDDINKLLNIFTLYNSKFINDIKINCIINPNTIIGNILNDLKKSYEQEVIIIKNVNS